MDYKFLNRVVEQIISETRIDYDRGVIESPFHFSSFFSSIYASYSFFLPSFVDHCRDVYGLNIQEREYVWKEYRETIIDKIKNNGL